MKRNIKSTSAGRRIIRKPEVRRLTSYSDTQIWRMEGDGTFPKRVQLGPMAVGWFEDEVLEWIESRVRQGGKRPPMSKQACVQERNGVTEPGNGGAAAVAATAGAVPSVPVEGRGRQRQTDRSDRRRSPGRV